MSQLMWYRNACEVLGLPVPNEQYLVVAEAGKSTPPSIIKLGRSAKLAGEAMWRSYFEQLLVCTAADHWPSYCEAVTELEVFFDEDEVEW